MTQPTVSSSSRRATNVTLPEALLREAREMGVNVSQACEHGLAAEVAALRRQRWLGENGAAMQAWNEHVLMARFDVHPMPGGGKGYVVDVQADLLSHLSTRVVVPLLPEAAVSRPISELNPVYDMRGVRHVLVTQALASIPGRELKRPISGLAEHRDSITRALDILLTGF